MKTHHFLKTICTAFLLVGLLSSKALWATTITTDTIIQDGEVYDFVDVQLNAVVNITGGMISGSLTGRDSSRINIWGGELGGPIQAWGDAQIIIYGSNFLLSGQSVFGTLDLDYLTDVGALTLSGFDSMDWSGNLTGTLANGILFDANILIRHLVGSNDTANFTLIPEPVSSLFLATGILFVRMRKSRLNPV